MSKIDTIVISGGGIRSIAVIGTLKYLEQNNILLSIKKYAGSSAGAVLVLLLNIGYTPSEIYDSIFSQKSSMVYDNFIKIPYNLLVNYGLFSGVKIADYLSELIVKKGFDKNTSFKQLYEKTGKTIVLTGSSLTDRDTYYFNHHNTPEMKVIDAVRISIGIPLFFTSVKYTIDNISHVFVDGGMLNNFPLYYFDICDSMGKYILTCKELTVEKIKDDKLIKVNFKNIDYKENVIGIMLIDDNETRDVDNFYNDKTIITNFSQYITAFIDTILSKIETDNFINPLTGVKSNFFNRVITISIPKNITAINFNISETTKQLLINKGTIAAQEFFEI